MSDTPPNQHENGKDVAQNDPGGYTVGYGRPPRNSQWRRGDCPNRRGRPRRDEGEPYSDLFDRISNEKVPIDENGRTIFLRRPQLLARIVVDRGIAGDPESEKILIGVEQPDLTPPEGSLHIEDVASEDEIPAKTRELLRRKKYRANKGTPSPARFGRGRPRNDAPFAELVKRELKKRIEVQENGRTLIMTKREAWMRRLWHDVISGKPRALRIYVKLAKPTMPPAKDFFFWIIDG